MAKRKGGLGKGLDALFVETAPVEEAEKNSAKPEKSTTLGSAGRTDAPADAADAVIYVDINDIRPNAAQPRKNFDEEDLKELAESIREHGVIQPLIIRNTGKGRELVAGERRWRAARLAGIKSVPCIVREFTEEQNAIVAIVENMQRKDLNPIEEANGIKRLVDTYGFTQEQASKAIGKSRAYIANSMRLLGLPEEIQALISKDKISAAHGRTLAGISGREKQIEACDKVVRNGLSVRATEKLVEKIKDDARLPRKKRAKADSKPTEIAAAEDELRKALGTKVNINGSASTGKIEIEYYSLAELNRLIDMLRDVSE
jgi:ParB family chromosome partitioning protein